MMENFTEWEVALYSLYESGQYDIYEIGNRMGVSGEFAYNVVKRITKYKRENGLIKKPASKLKPKSEIKEYDEICATCRWCPCDGAPCCYLREIDHGRA